MRKKILFSLIILLVVTTVWLAFTKIGKEGPALVNTKSSQEILSGLGVPVEMVLIDYSRFDTNNDGKIETLVITKDPVKERAHYYILDETGNKLYEQSNILSAPERIELRNYKDDKYKSFFLVFKEQYKEGHFIWWNGEEYEIPEEER